MRRSCASSRRATRRTRRPAPAASPPLTLGELGRRADDTGLAPGDDAAPTCSATTSRSAEARAAAARSPEPGRRRELHRRPAGAARVRRPRLARAGAARPDGRRGDAGPREYLNAYLRSLDAEREGLPPWFVERIERAVAPLRRRFARAERRRSAARCCGSSSAQQRRDRAGRGGLGAARDPARRRVRGADRRAGGTARRDARPARSSRRSGATRRSPAWPGPSATATSTGRSSSDHRDEVSAEMRAVIADLLDPAATSRRSRRPRSMTLVACPLPLMGLLTEADRFASTADPSGRCSRCSTRRYYKIRRLEQVRVERADGFTRAARPVLATTTAVVQVLAVRSLAGEVGAALDAVGRRGLPTSRSPTPPSIDLYVPLPAGDERSADELAADSRPNSTRAPCPGWCAASPSSLARAAAPPIHLDVPPGRRRTACAPTGCSPTSADDENSRPDRFRRGRHVPRAAPDDRPPPADVAAVQLRDRPTPVGRRRVRVPVRRPREPRRHPARGRGRGARPHAGPRRQRAGGRPARRRARPRSVASTRSAKSWPGGPTPRASSGTG